MAGPNDICILGSWAHSPPLLAHYAPRVLLLIRNRFDLDLKPFVGHLGVAPFLAILLLPVLKEIKWQHLVLKEVKTSAFFLI